MSKKNLPILEKHIVRSSSQPKFKLSKNKLAPIPEQKKPKILKGSNSQKSFNKIYLALDFLKNSGTILS